MAEEIGLLCIPSSPFFSLARAEQGVSDSFIRIAFCKEDETIEAAAVALQRIKDYYPSNNNNNNSQGDDATEAEATTAEQKVQTR